MKTVLKIILTSFVKCQYMHGQKSFSFTLPPWPNSARINQILFFNRQFSWYSLLFLFQVYYQNYEYMLPIKLLDYKGYYGNTKLQRFTIPDDCLFAVNNCFFVFFCSVWQELFFYLEIISSLRFGNFNWIQRKIVHRVMSTCKCNKQ